jgi:glutamate-5-semialdehyde dehydrogenase
MAPDAFEISETIKDYGFRSREARLVLANTSADLRNRVIRSIAEAMQKDRDIVLSANEKDLENGREAGLNAAMLDRLTLHEKRFAGILESLEQIIRLPDPLGRVLDQEARPNGLEITRVSVPIGVIGLIYESRPNVTVEAAALAIKSGNTIILKGGREAFLTNRALADCVRAALEANRLPADCVLLVPFKDRSATLELLKQDDTVDLIVPRGGEGLIRFVTENSRIPVIKHYKGLCHTYIDREADPEAALRIAVNAKVQRPGVCNAMETLLVHREIAPSILPRLLKEYREHGVTLRGCPETRRIDPAVEEASEEDWAAEYLDKILSIRVVAGVEDAAKHIERFGSRHSEAVITQNRQTAARFVQMVDAAAVFVNASTRFHDGFEFGLGAEMGISTDKLHCRGPMGLREMTTYKYVVIGKGQIRE